MKLNRPSTRQQPCMHALYGIVVSVRASAMSGRSLRAFNASPPGCRPSRVR